MRIVAGAWRGRTLVAPPGQGTRPTADRVRQALFDMLIHAEWGGRAAIEGAVVLDVFAGTGALGLEALSRGAASACFIESDPVALKALRANVAACRAEDRAQVLAGDALRTQPLRTVMAELVPAICPPTVRAQMAGTRPAMMIGQSTATTTRAATATISGPKVAPASLVFLDPPYGQDLVHHAIAHLQHKGYIAPGALVVAETGRDEIWLPEQPVLAERRYGAARVLVFQTFRNCK